MCARRFGPLPGYELVDGPGWGRVVVSPPRNTITPVVDATPLEVVRAALEAVAPRPGETLYDLGCGDGRVLIEAIRGYGCMAVGIEIDPMVADRARRNLETSGVPKRWRVVLGDARNFRYPKADVAFLYQSVELMEALVPKLTGARAVVSYSHDLGSLPAERREVAGGHPIYVWERPVLVAPSVTWPALQVQFPSLMGGSACPVNLAR